MAQASGNTGAGTVAQRCRWHCSLCSRGFNWRPALDNHLSGPLHSTQALVRFAAFARSDLLLVQSISLVTVQHLVKPWSQYMIGCKSLYAGIANIPGTKTCCLHFLPMPESQWMALLNRVNRAVRVAGGWAKPLYLQLADDKEAEERRPPSLEPAPCILLYDLPLLAASRQALISALGPEIPAGAGASFSYGFYSAYLVPLLRQPPRSAMRMSFIQAAGRHAPGSGIRFLWMESGKPRLLGSEAAFDCAEVDPPGLLQAMHCGGQEAESVCVTFNPSVAETYEPASLEEIAEGQDRIRQPEQAVPPLVIEMDVDQDEDEGEAVGDVGGNSSGKQHRPYRLAPSTENVRVWRLHGFHSAAKDDEIELALRRSLRFPWEQVISYKDCISGKGLPRSQLSRFALLSERSGLTEKVVGDAIGRACQSPEVTRLTSGREIVYGILRRPFWVPISYGDGLANRSQFLVVCGLQSVTTKKQFTKMRALLPLARSFTLPQNNLRHEIGGGKPSLGEICVARFDSHQDCAKSLGELTAAVHSSQTSQITCARFVAMFDKVELTPRPGLTALSLPAHNCLLWQVGEPGSDTTDCQPFTCECHSTVDAELSDRSVPAWKILGILATKLVQRTPKNCSPQRARELALDLLDTAVSRV